MRSRSLYAISIAALLSSSRPVTAEPIRATYDIQIFFRHSYLLDREELFFQRFSLVLTVDDRIISSQAGPTFLDLSYGPPVFSAVPLEGPEAPSTFPLQQVSRTRDLWSKTHEQVFHARSGEAVTFIFTRDGFSGGTYGQGISMTNLKDELSERPIQTARSLLEFLADADHPFKQLEFSYHRFLSLRETGVTADSFAYRGTATLVELSDPVPEPASLTLVMVGGAVAAFAKRRSVVRWRRNRFSST